MVGIVVRKDDTMMKVGDQTTWDPIDFQCMDKNILQNIFFCPLELRTTQG